MWFEVLLRLLGFTFSSFYCLLLKASYEWLFKTLPSRSYHCLYNETGLPGLEKAWWYLQPLQYNTRVWLTVSGRRLYSALCIASRGKTTSGLLASGSILSFMAIFASILLIICKTRTATFFFRKTVEGRQWPVRYRAFLCGRVMSPAVTLTH